ncbi:His Kinase A (phospho-acceptor) domain-containing protein [Duganella sp. CF402]|uniref:sensor histidine kinase n=1 Tax=unclassified Duganella TaxID=2636909 RepID=UPI0008CD2AC1|nr:MULTISPECIES: sensor histidine kinase [unclassified Duganella]RZT05919.1 phospho-acceptor domain-containing protein [Duganella sp. BK701]SEN17252.1 His Kinase A (phospho-acceptor) domain-containing protein [Duganella sp. CF402]
MHSLLPAVVSLLFLCYGAYVLHSRGVNRISLTFFLLCSTTFCWQFTWAILFQMDDEHAALSLAKLGYLLILFLPTTLYHFIAELTAQRGEGRWVALSYTAAGVLGLLLLTSDWLVAGLYRYFFGFYPRAGLLHPLHLLQTALVVGRGLWLLYRRQRMAVSTERTRLRYCLVSLLIYFFASVDYLCNYGVQFYPPGVLFVATSLGLIAQAMVRYNLLADPLEVAATIAHEMRTPLATIRNQSRILSRCLPDLLAGYQRAVEAQLVAPTLSMAQLQYMQQINQYIENEISRSNFIVDMMLASARAGTLARSDFANHSIKKCVEEALASYPFETTMREKVRVRGAEDFTFFGSDVLLVYVLYNLFKNALHAIKAAGRGEVEIRLTGRQLMITDTGSGIPDDILPHVFEPFYSTGGTGMGLAFCRKVITAFGGNIQCESQAGKYTRFALSFPYPTN